MDVTLPDHRVVTFYSFKGGVGRSMALANIAFRLADRHDLDVIVVDWDLEAPGLHRFFGISDEMAATKHGLLDYLLAWREAVEDEAEAPPDVTKWLLPITDPTPDHGSLSLLLAGKLDAGYADRLRGFDWLPFYQVNAGAAAVETLRRQLAEKADMVLVDSRTGVTDAGGICTVQMPDGVVLLTAANEQSFAGIERVARSIADGEGDRPGRAPPKVWVAVARDPYLDLPRYGEDWFDRYSARFDAGCDERLWAKMDHPRGIRSHRLPHVGRWGFGEQIIDKRAEADDPLAMAYAALCEELVEWGLGKEKQEGGQEGRKRRTIEELRRDVERAEERGDLARLGNTLMELGSAQLAARDFSNAAEAFQKAAGIQLARGEQGAYAGALTGLGEVRRVQGRLGDAATELQRGLAVAQRLGLSAHESIISAALAGVERQRGESDKAEG